MSKGVAVFGIVPAFEAGWALFGEGGARLDEVALGAMVFQRGGEALLFRRRRRAHLAPHIHGVDARGRRQGQEMLGHRQCARDQLVGVDERFRKPIS
jgi:hypothetical protein